MAITKAQYETELDAIKTAILAGNWATAYDNYALAEITLAGLEVRAGHNSDFYQLRESLSAIKKALDASRNVKQSTAGDSGFIKTKTRYQGQR